MSSPLLQLQSVIAAPASGAPAVLRDVNLSLKAGECLAIVGASGAGKTTLLRTIAGQIAPSGGAIRFEDRDQSGLLTRQQRARIGMITQRQDLVDSHRVHTNVMAGALGRWSTVRALRYLLRPTSAELEEAAAALRAVGLEGKLHLRTAQLSGGEQQRVAVARGLVQAPRLFLADEPVASLDRFTAENVLALLTGLARARGTGLICSLHQPELAERFCDRVLEVGGGTLRERPA